MEQDEMDRNARKNGPAVLRTAGASIQPVSFMQYWTSK